MRSLVRCVWNLVFYWRWTDCRHEWEAFGFADWRCAKCKADR